MFCGQCGESIVEGSQFCAKCGVSLLPSAPPGRQSTNTPASSHVIEPSVVRPWVRYWARMLDVYTFSIICGLILGIVAPQFLEKQNDFLVGVIFIFAWVFGEASLLSSFQTTPGKLLFKTTIAHKSGLPIDFSQALERSFQVWWRGMGIGFPLVMLFTTLTAYRRLTRNGQTSWDNDGQFTITHGKIGVWRVLAAVVFFLAFFALMAVGQRTNA